MTVLKKSVAVSAGLYDFLSVTFDKNIFKVILLLYWLESLLSGYLFEYPIVDLFEDSCVHLWANLCVGLLLNESLDFRSGCFDFFLSFIVVGVSDSFLV